MKLFKKNKRKTKQDIENDIKKRQAHLVKEYERAIKKSLLDEAEMIVLKFVIIMIVVVLYCFNIACLLLNWTIESNELIYPMIVNNVFIPILTILAYGCAVGIKRAVIK